MHKRCQITLAACIVIVFDSAIKIRARSKRTAFTQPQIGKGKKSRLGNTIFSVHAMRNGIGSACFVCSVIYSDPKSDSQLKQNDKIIADQESNT